MIQIETIETPGLGDRSYLATDGRVAVVVDPQRDIDRVLEVANRLGVQVEYVLETHVHNDYVSGGLELAAVTGAGYVVSAGDVVSFDRIAAHDGDVLEAGTMRVRVVSTPGHTHHHLSYVLEDEDGVVAGAFTGGSMLHGATGRTDLVGPEHTRELTHAQFHSVRRLAAQLPDDIEVFPTHGFGSFCSATPTDGGASTIGAQRTANPALTLAEEDYVRTLLAGLDAYPAYYSRMGPINSAGPAPVDLSVPRQVDPAELRSRIEAGEWVVDLRDRTVFAAGHLSGTLAFELSDSFVTYLGWLYTVGSPLTLIGTDEQVAAACRELVRIGVDEPAGAATGDITTLADGRELRSYRVSDFAGLAEAKTERKITVLDARRNDERAASRVDRSTHIPLHELAGRLGEVPAGEVWVYCGSGYRASIAASILDRDGDRTLVLVNDSFDAADKAGLLEPPA